MVIRKNDSGRSIVEMLGVLAIMGVITVMGISGYSQAVEKIKRNGTVESITKIVQEIRALYATSDNYVGLDNDKLSGIGLNLKGPYGGNITVAAVNGAGANPGFSVTVPNIPSKDCAYYSTMKWADVMSNDITTPEIRAYFGPSTISGSGTQVTVSAVAGDRCDANLSAMTLYYR